MEGADKVLKNLKKFGDNVEKALDRALKISGLDLLGKTKLEVPLDRSTLMMSGNYKPVNTLGEKAVQVGYNTPYALRLHEHPEYKFKGGRKGKFLSDPLKKNASKYEGFIRKQITADALKVNYSK